MAGVTTNGTNHQENEMTDRTSTSTQHSSKHGCCDSEASKDKATPAAAAANPKAVPTDPTAKPSVVIEGDGHSCHDKSHTE